MWIAHVIHTTFILPSRWLRGAFIVLLCVCVCVSVVHCPLQRQSILSFLRLSCRCVGFLGFSVVKNRQYPINGMVWHRQLHWTQNSRITNIWLGIGLMRIKCTYQLTWTHTPICNMFIRVMWAISRNSNRATRFFPSLFRCRVANSINVLSHERVIGWNFYVLFCVHRPTVAYKILFYIYWTDGRTFFFYFISVWAFFWTQLSICHRNRFDVRTSLHFVSSSTRHFHLVYSSRYF